MNKSLVIKNKIYLFSLLVFSFVLFLYLSYFLMTAERGVISFYKIKNKNIFYENELLLLNNINTELEDKISRLNPDTLDLDYLDQQIRFKTGFVAKNELVVVLDK